MDCDGEGVGKRWTVTGRGWRRDGWSWGGGGEVMESHGEGVGKGWMVMVRGWGRDRL